MRQEVKIYNLNSECYFVYAHLSTGHPNFILWKTMEQNTFEILSIVVFVILYLYGLKVLSVKKHPQEIDDSDFT